MKTFFLDMCFDFYEMAFLYDRADNLNIELR